MGSVMFTGVQMAEGAAKVWTHADLLQSDCCKNLRSEASEGVVVVAEF